MDLHNTFIIYLILFRLSIILTGLVSITLGYKLFAKGVFANGKPSIGGTDFQASIAGNNINMKNAAPGTMFALFGVILISVMVWNSSPELVKESLKTFDEGKNKGNSTKVTLRLRNEDTEKLKAMMQEVVNTQMATGGALKFLFDEGKYEKALMNIANHLNALAWQYKEKGRLEDALPMSKLAVSFCPKEPNFLDTLAETYFELQRYDLAIEYMEKVCSYDKSKNGRLKEFKKVLSANKSY